MYAQGSFHHTMNGFEHSIQDIAKATGLTRKYIDRCYKTMPFLEDYRHMSAEENKYYYNSGAFDIFQQIASLKAQHKNRQEIKEHLEKDGLGSRVEAEKGDGEEEGSTLESLEQHPTYQPQMIPSDTNLWIKALQASSSQAVDALKDALAAKDALVTAKDVQIHALEERLLALPDGRTPEQIKAELEVKEQQTLEIEVLRRRVGEAEHRAAERKRLVAEYEQLPVLGKRKQKRELLAAIKALDEDA